MKAAALLVLAALCGATAGRAATYGCVGSDGRTTFSDRPCPASATDSVRREAGVEGYAAARHGVTFGVERLGDGNVDARCDAAPAPLDRPHQGGCDAQRGDTACSRALPVLCFKPGARRTRAPATVDPASGRITWPSAADDPQLGMTPARRGDSLASPQSGTQACASALGAGWRMAGIDDGVQWAPHARRHASLDAVTSRLWVASADAPANCWSAAPPARPDAAARGAPEAGARALPDELSRLRSSPEFARLSPSCRQRYDALERDLGGSANPGAINPTSLEPVLAWLQDCGMGLGAGK
jgi:hypothetical protein